MTNKAGGGTEMIGKRDIVEISCKILGLLCLLWSLRQIVPALLITTMDHDKAVHFMVQVVASFVLYLILAYVLLRFSKGIALLLMREDQSVEIRALGEWQRPLYTVCLRVVGAVVFVRAVPSVIKEILRLLSIRMIIMRSFMHWTSLISAIVYLALGIYFIGGARAIVKIAMKDSLKEATADE
ncbi:hypothetical protein ACFL6S_18920 [Candidatus Poribacteria bacterium]